MKKILFTLLCLPFLTACDPSASMVKIEDEASSTVQNNWTEKDFEGRPSVIVFGGTYCPHCVKAVPVFEKDVVQKYSDQINIWVQVIDGQGGKKFSGVDIPQGYNPSLTHQGVSGKSCGYVPSWVVLDENFKPTLISCGSERQISEMVKEIEKLLK